MKPRQLRADLCALREIRLAGDFAVEAADDRRRPIIQAGKILAAPVRERFGTAYSLCRQVTLQRQDVLELVADATRQPASRACASPV